MINKALENNTKRREWIEQCLIECWDDLIRANTDSGKVCVDLQMLVTQYIESMDAGSKEDEYMYNDLQEFQK